MPAIVDFVICKYWRAALTIFTNRDRLLIGVDLPSVDLQHNLVVVVYFVQQLSFSQVLLLFVHATFIVFVVIA